jgi:cytochrome c peroxidase
VFFQETFRGNGRTCATCHQRETEFALTPEFVQATHDRDPGNPLFRPIDSDDGVGQDYTTLLQHALIAVEIPLAANVSLVNEPARRSIIVRRAVPSIVNVALTAPYQLDGRIPTLRAQARAAIKSHFQPRREPTPREILALVSFQSDVFEPQRLKQVLAAPEGSPPAPGFSMPVSAPAAVQGRAVFQRACARCHGGETGSLVNAGTPPAIDISVSEANRVGLPVFRLQFRNPDGTVRIVDTPDPGRAAVTGDLNDLNAFDVPALRGIKHTAPYFHDNSAATLGAVIDHYNEFVGTNIDFRDRDALIAFLETL